MLKNIKILILSLALFVTAGVGGAQAYTDRDVSRLRDFATIIGASVACDIPVEEDLKLVVYWAAATFGEDVDKHMLMFQDELDEVISKSILAAKRKEGIPCSRTTEMRNAAIEYLRAALYLYKLEGKLPKPAEMSEDNASSPPTE